MNARRFDLIALLLGATVFVGFSAAARSQQFESWQGKPAVHDGEGGTKQVVEGIDIWDRGTPPGKFIVIGYIHDKRHKSGLIGKIAMAHLNRDVAKVAKQAGGDAVIAVSSEDETLGTVEGGFASTNASAHVAGNSAYGQAQTSSFGFSRAVREQESEYAVLKYVQDNPATAAPEPNSAKSEPPSASKP